MCLPIPPHDNGCRGETRTRKAKSQWILSPSCLPISPHDNGWSNRDRTYIAGTKNPCLTVRRYSNMAHHKRIEHISTVLETVVLPLNQWCVAEGERFELSEQDFPLSCFQDSRVKPLCQPSKKVGFAVTNLQNLPKVCSEPVTNTRC